MCTVNDMCNERDHYAVSNSNLLFRQCSDVFPTQSRASTDELNLMSLYVNWLPKFETHVLELSISWLRAFFFTEFHIALFKTS
jgi:hypothetical protein